MRQRRFSATVGSGQNNKSSRVGNILYRKIGKPLEPIKLDLFDFHYFVFRFRRDVSLVSRRSC